MDIQDIFQRLNAQFAPAVVLGPAGAIDPWIEVSAAVLPGVCLFLRDEPALRFNLLHCITGVDYFEVDAKKAAAVEWQPHVELVYHLSSLVHRHRLVLKVMLPRWQGDVAGRLPEVPSLSDIWRTADWHEREVFDLFGISFLGHPDFRRILLPEDWVGHPLRKDYVMPSEYHGIPGR
jgi:NADH-quinone oxidoreductase subunit C